MNKYLTMCQKGTIFMDMRFHIGTEIFVGGGEKCAGMAQRYQTGDEFNARGGC